jgi:hypothetical protein
MKLYSKVIAIGLVAAIAAATPGISNADVYRHREVSTSAQVVVHDDNVAPVLAVLVGGLVLASAIHASQQCEPVVVAGPACAPPPVVYEARGRGWDDCDERGGWHRDRGWHGKHGRGHERGWERHGD